MLISDSTAVDHGNQVIIYCFIPFKGCRISGANKLPVD